MPFFMAFDRVRYEISAFGLYPPVDRFIICGKAGEIEGKPAGYGLRGPSVMDQMAFHCYLVPEQAPGY
ncbi:MAG: hypothetical protein LBH58_03600, partial [Tannerellaceae bacterium]|jgi:hypothetical protein|nr:hypothetical protein [Tannerellaceae bacterium]